MNQAVIGIDLGGTKLAGAIFDSFGKIYNHQHYYLESRQGPQVAKLLLQIIGELMPKAAQNSLDIQAIGIAVPGIFNSTAKTVWAPNIPGWEEYPLYSEIRNYLRQRIPVIIDNDRACYISGEVWQGAAQGCNDAIFLAVGTGIGAGILTGGQLLRGHADIAGSIGWMALTDAYHPQYNSCGCFEFHASGRGITNLVNTSYQKHGSNTVSTQGLFLAYEQQDPVAREVLTQAVVFWGKAVANLVSLFNPQKIIFGGGVFGPARQFLDDIYQEAIKWAQPISMRQVSLGVSQLGEDTGLYGAAYLALSKISSANE